jgi:hypothetical protein
VRLELLYSVRRSRDFQTFRADLLGFRDLRVDGWVIDFAEVIQAASRRAALIVALPQSTCSSPQPLLVMTLYSFITTATSTGLPE